MEAVEQALKSEHGELPIIEWDMPIAEGAPTRTVRMYANTKSGSMTLVVIIENTVGCLGGAGENFRIAPQFSPKDQPL